MTRLRLAPGRANALVLVVAAATALAASGCASDTTTTTSNGLERMPAAKVQRIAAAALESTDGIHVTGTGLADRAASFDLRFDRTSSAGTLVAAGVHVELTRIGDAFYVNTGRRGLEKLGAPAAAARIGADRWLKLGLAQITQWEGFSLADLARQLAEHDSPLDPQVAQATLDGKPVVVLSHQDGSTLYVANTGAPYPLRAHYTGPAAGRIDFTDYGADFRITPPEHPVDIGKLPGRDQRAGAQSPAPRHR